MHADDPPFNYDPIADVYAAYIDESPYNAFYERPAMLGLLPEVAGARVLDAGCGNGWYAEQLLGRGARLTAIDGSERMLGHARERLSRLARPPGVPEPVLRFADLGQPLDLPDASFDGILSALVLHYLRDWGPTLREFRRVLRPGGWLLFSTHHPMLEAVRLGTRRYFEVEPVADVWERIGPVRYYRRSLTATADDLAAAGFLIERMVEPYPTEAFRAAKPEAYEDLLRAPAFLLFRARTAGNG
jgi:SAM-dependent methyltransferase